MNRHSLLLLPLFALLAACGGHDSHPAGPAPGVDAPAATPISAAQIASIDDFVAARMDREHIPGVSLVVTMNGSPVLQKSYGYANLASGILVAPSTVFHIASVSKQFTASAIMMLVQDGRMNVDDPVLKYLPTLPAAWQAITVRQLLTHTSGLPRDFSDALIGQIDPLHLPPIDTLVALAGQMPLEHAPGAAYSYSNVGYHLLGFVIEKVSGKYYADFLRERVFAPLAMDSAGVIQTSTPVPGMATGYTLENGALKPATSITSTPGFFEAEGGLQMTAADLAKWDAALLTERFLTKASLAAMWTPARLNDGSTVPYGFGWVLDEINHRPYTWHNGELEGYTSSIERHPAQGLSVIVFTNQDKAAPKDIAARVASIVKPELEWVIGTDPQPATGLLLRGLLDEAARGALVADDRFSATVRAALTPERIAGLSAEVKAWGSVERFGYIDQVESQGVAVSRYLVRTRTDRAVIGIALDANGRVAVLTLLPD